MSRDLKFTIGALGILFLIICCCTCVALMGLVQLFSGDAITDFLDETLIVSPAPTEIPATLPPPPSEKDEDISLINFQNIQATVVNQFDLAEGARMFYGIQNVPEYLLDEDAPYDVGDTKSFWIINTDTNENTTIEAVLEYETEHVYFWVEEGEDFDRNDLVNLAEEFEEKIYPITREFFGSEFYPGIDQDPHIYIIYTGGLGRNVGGLFSSADSIHPLVIDYSNGHETFYISADNQDLGESYTYGVLAHEFQHMIQWNIDRNETTWLNEGFSELAIILNDYDPGYFDYFYLQDTDMQLNSWPSNGNNGPNYGASLLFVTYFHDRFGEDVTKQLVAHEDNGLESIDNLMVELGITDGLSGEVVTADDIVLDWAIANFIQDNEVSDGRYDYQTIEPYTTAPITLELQSCDEIDKSQTVNQYGTDYIKFGCRDDQLIEFTGNQLVDLLPQKPYSGEYAFWTNQGDESKMMLTRKFDFTGHTGEISFTYKIWHDIEVDYDYLYLVASLDGENWDIVETPSGTDEDPSGNNYGWGYNGLSSEEGGWIKEIVDLSEYAGEEVYIGFLYITDAGVNGEGALIDDVYIPETGYFENFEDGSGGWDTDGFVLVSQQIPQTFKLALIRLGKDISVEYLELSEDNKVEFEVKAHERSVLVIVGTTRFTHQPAVYRIQAVE